MRSGLGRIAPPRARQAQHEGRPALRRRAGLEAPAVLARDAAAGREAGARAAASGLGRVEGLEDALERLRGDARAVVADLDPHALALPAARDPEGPAPSFERLDRILEQVEEDLVERPGVALDLGEPGLELEAQLDRRLAQRVAEQLGGRGEAAAQVDGPARAAAGRREVAQVADQALRALEPLARDRGELDHGLGGVVEPGL